MFLNAPDYGVLVSYLNDMPPDINTGLYDDITKESQTLQPVPLLLRPRSRGYIKLKSINPREAPAIVPNYFEDPHDVQVLVCYIISLILVIRRIGDFLSSSDFMKYGRALS